MRALTLSRSRVCVPIDPADAHKFNPLGVPTVAALLNELDAVEAGAGEEWARTSLAPAVATFRTTFLDPLLAACASGKDKKAAVTDW